ALDDMSLLPDGAILAAGEQKRGVPAVPAVLNLPSPVVAIERKRRPVLFGFIHLALIYAMGYFLILAFLPSVVLLIYAFVQYGPLEGLGAIILSAPLSYLWYIFCVVFLKRVIIGRIRPGTYSTQSATYVRYWFQDYLLNNTKEIIQPLYATIYFPT